MRSFPFLVTSLLIILLASCAAVGEVTPRASSTPIVLFQFNPASATPRTETPVASPEPSLTPSSTPNNLPDLSGQTISLAFLCDRSGPLAETDAARIAGATDAVAYINSNGGIFGAQLELQFGDTQGTVEGARRAEARLMRESPDTRLILICDSLSEGALTDTLNEDKIPALVPGEFSAENGYFFDLDAPPEQHVAVWLRDLATYWRDRRPQGAGDEIKLAILSWPADFVGPVATHGLLAYAESLGIQIVMQNDLPADITDSIFDFIYSARDEGVNVIYTNARSEGLAALLNAINNLGLRDRFVLGAPAAAYDNDLFTFLADPSFANGLYLTSAWAWWGGESNSSIETAKQILAAGSWHPDWPDWSYLQMVAAVDLADQAIQDAILTDGFEGLSKGSVTDALENLDSYDVLNGIFTVNYSDGTRSLDQLAVWQSGATPGELTLISPLAPLPTLIP